jgi:hypothetical protein
MKKIAVLALACAAALLAIPPASAQLRLDVGAIAFKGLDVDGGDHDKDDSRNKNGFLERVPVLPIFEADLFYQRGFGPFDLGVGVRAFSLFAESLAWPNVRAELEYGRLAVEFQVGAGAFAMFGILPRSDLGSVFIPDLSAWYKVGGTGKYSLGGGVMGLYVPRALGDSMTVLFYVGGKISLLR